MLPRHTSTSLASAFTPIGQRELHRNHINLKQSGYSDLAAKSISLGAGLGRYTGVESLENAREGRWEDGAALTSYQRAGQFALGTFGVVTTATGAAKGITGAVSNAGAQGLSRQAVQRFTPYFDNSAASPAGAANPAPVGGVVEVAAEGLLELPVLNPHFTPNPTKVVGSENAYSVAFRARLPSTDYPGQSRSFHFQQANRQLIEAMDADPQIARQIESLIPNIRSQLIKPRSYSRQSPAGWTWHHHSDTGVLELIPRVQHEAAGPLQHLLHPGGQGGMNTWGQ